MKGTIIVKRTGENNELYHWLKKGEAAKDHKYVRREWKNGEWRYYYDNDDQADKGLSVKVMPKTKITSRFGLNTSADGKGTKVTTYRVGSQSVDKAVYDHTKTVGLYYKNEPVTDIGARAVKKATKTMNTILNDATDTISNFIKKGRSMISNFIKSTNPSATHTTTSHRITFNNEYEKR